MENRKPLFGGIFFLCLSLLMYEIILTRIFSVLLWYHFAFLVISVALFGNGVSALFLYILKKYFPPERLNKDLQIISFFIPVTMIVSLYILLKMDMKPELSFKIFSKDFYNLSFVFILSALPFLFGGMCISLALYHSSKNIHRLYFYDLFGAGLGCFLTVPILSIFGGPGGILFTSVLAGFSCISFSYFTFSSEKNILIRLRKPISVLLILAGLILSVVNNISDPVFRIRQAKSIFLDKMNILFSKWNSFSMVIVYPDKEIFHGWAISPKYKGEVPEQMRIVIDLGALTEITKFNGDFKSVEYTQYDYSSIVHALKKDYDCCIIGPGGGKDVLSALAYGAKSVIGVEINPIIAEDIMQDKFLDFSGHIYDHPKVDIVVDDGRSFIRKTQKNFDIIQLSMVDTSAATAAGAYVLSENSLYTVDAFLDYFSKLKENGILSVSWVNMKVLEGGTRLVSLARASLESKGIKNPGDHIVVLMHPNKYNVNVLIKRDPFTQQEADFVMKHITNLGFEAVHVPYYQADQNIMTEIIYARDEKDLNKIYSNYLLDVSPVTDEKPFFFYQNRISDFFRVLFKSEAPDFFGAGLFILSKIIWICVIFTLLFLILPIFFWHDKTKDKHLTVWVKSHRIIYFVCLGIGFMCIEIPLLQRFVLFLGHPIYSLSVVLLSVLCFCGIGSFLTEKIRQEKLKLYLNIIILILILSVIGYFYFLTPLLKACLVLPQALKVLLTVLFLSPLGLLLGICFPAGLRLMDNDSHQLIPWFWSMNSASSVLGSVLSVFFSINFGIGKTMILGAIIYFIAFLIILTLKEIKIEK